MRIYYDSDGLKDKDIAALGVLYSNSYNGSYTELLEVPYNPSVDWIEFETPENFDFYWFKLDLKNSAGSSEGTTEPFVGGYFAKLIEDTRQSLGDTNLDDPAFTDEEYYIKIREAVKIHYGVDVVTIQDGDLSFLLLLIMESCCYNLAYDNAKYSKISLPDGIALDKGERVEHYLSIAKALRDRYEYYTQDSEAASSGNVSMGTISSNTYFKRKRRT